METADDYLRAAKNFARNSSMFESIYAEGLQVRKVGGEWVDEPEDLEIAAHYSHVYLSALTSELSLKVLYLLDNPNGEPKKLRHSADRLYEGLNEDIKWCLNQSYDQVKTHLSTALEKRKWDVGEPADRVTVATLQEYWVWCEDTVVRFKYTLNPGDLSVPCGVVWGRRGVDGKGFRSANPIEFPNYSHSLVRLAQIRHEHGGTG